MVYLIDSDTINARFLWKRIPDQLKSETLELQNIWKVGQFLWKRDFSNVFATVSKQEWSALLQPLFSKLLEKLRIRLLALVGHAYSNIKIENLCLLLGLDENQVIELVLKKSWEIDMDNKIVKPTVQASNTEDSELIGKHSDLLMSNLTDYIAFLEN